MRGLSLVAVFALAMLNASELNVGEIDVLKPEISQGGRINSSFLSTQEFNISQADKNKNITQIIKKSSNISFGSDGAGSINAADIRPQDFSINGAMQYQNSFNIDGMSFNNDIDPAWNASHAHRNMYRTPGLGTQSTSINTNLLKSFEIIDSNVSAKYGRFEGGVINAKTRDPEAPFAAGINYTYTDGNLNKIFIDENKKRLFYTDPNSIQNNYTKSTMSAYVESRLNDDFGLLFSFTEQRSHIKKVTPPALAKSGYTYPNEKQIDRNFMLKGFYAFGDHIFRPSIIYAPTRYSGHLKNALNSDYTAKFGGPFINLELFSEFERFNMTQSLSYTSQDSTRIFDKEVEEFFIVENRFASEELSNISRGGMGHKSEKEKNLKYQLDIEVEPFEYRNAEHNIQAGLLLEYKSAKTALLKKFERYTTPKVLPKDYVCQPSDIHCYMGEVIDRWGNAGDGQFLARYIWADPYTYKQSARNFAAYLEDEIKYKKINFRIGARFEYDGIIKQTSLAPRMSTELAFSDKHSAGFGFNRYYGRSFYTYSIHNKIYRPYVFEERKHPSEDFKQYFNQTDTYIPSKIKPPYTDEISFFYKGEIKDTFITFKYLKRMGRDQVVTSTKSELGLADIDDDKLDEDYSVYTNKGRKKSHIYTLDIQRAFKLFNVQNQLNLSATYTVDKSGSGISSYNTRTKYLDSKVRYEGRIIDIKDLPNTNFHDDYKIVLNHSMSFENLSIGNLFSYIPGKTKLIRWRAKRFDMWNYEKVKLKPYFSWDMNIHYQRKFGKISGYVNVNITNLLNTKLERGVMKRNDIYMYDYEKGRGITVDFGLKY